MDRDEVAVAELIEQHYFHQWQGWQFDVSHDFLADKFQAAPAMAICPTDLTG